MLKESEQEARTKDHSGPAGLHQTVLRLRDEAKGHLKVIGSLKEQLERKAVEVSDWERRTGTLEGRPTTELLHHKTARQHLSHKVGLERKPAINLNKQCDNILENPNFFHSYFRLVSDLASLCQ